MPRETVANKIEGLTETVASLQSDAMELLAEVKGKIGGVDQRINGVESSVQGVRDGLSGVDQRINGVDASVQGVRDGLGGLDHRINGVDASVQGVRDSIAAVAKGVSTNRWIIGVVLGISLGLPTLSLTLINNLEGELDALREDVDAVKNGLETVASEVSGVKGSQVSIIEALGRIEDKLPVGDTGSIAPLRQRSNDVEEPVFRTLRPVPVASGQRPRTVPVSTFDLLTDPAYAEALPEAKSVDLFLSSLADSGYFGVIEGLEDTVVLAPTDDAIVSAPPAVRDMVVIGERTPSWEAWAEMSVQWQPSTFESPEVGQFQMRVHTDGVYTFRSDERSALTGSQYLTGFQYEIAVSESIRTTTGMVHFLDTVVLPDEGLVPPQ